MFVLSSWSLFFFQLLDSVILGVLNCPILNMIFSTKYTFRIYIPAMQDRFAEVHGGHPSKGVVSNVLA